MTETSKPVAEMTDAERLAAPYVRDPELLPIGADPDGPRPFDPTDPRQREAPAPTAAEDRAARDPRLRRAGVSLGRQVKAYRAAHGLTQKDVAERLGWDQATVARLEAGLVSPNLATLALLSERLGVRLVLTPEAGGLLVTLEPLKAVAGQPVIGERNERVLYLAREDGPERHRGTVLRVRRSVFAPPDGPEGVTDFLRPGGFNVAVFRVACLRALRALRALWRRGPGAVPGGDHGGVPRTPAPGEAAAGLLVDGRPPAVLDRSPFREGDQRRFVADLAERRSRDARSPPLT